MKRIIQGLALAVVASTAQAAPGDAYPAGGAPLFVTAKQTHASLNLREGEKMVSAFPAGTPAFVTSKETYADRHASDANTQTGYAFPGQASGAGD